MPNRSCFGGFDISSTQNKLFWSYTILGGLNCFNDSSKISSPRLEEPQKGRYWAEILYVKSCWQYLQDIRI